jgi:hypothetical protein
MLGANTIGMGLRRCALKDVNSIKRWVFMKMMTPAKNTAYACR